MSAAWANWLKAICTTFADGLAIFAIQVAAVRLPLVSFCQVGQHHLPFHKTGWSVQKSKASKFCFL